MESLPPTKSTTDRKDFIVYSVISSMMFCTTTLRIRVDGA